MEGDKMPQADPATANTSETTPEKDAEDKYTPSPEGLTERLRELTLADRP